MAEGWNLVEFVCYRCGNRVRAATIADGSR
jgi:hypothetical protein